MVRVALRPKVFWQSVNLLTLYLVQKNGIIEPKRTKKIASSLKIEPRELNVALVAFGVDNRLSFVLSRLEESTRSLNCAVLISVQGSRREFKQVLDEVIRVNLSTTEGRTVILRKARKRIGLIRHWNIARELVERLNPDNEFFCWMSDHDYFENLALVKAVSELKFRPDVAAVIPPVKWEESNGHLLSVSPKHHIAQDMNTFRKNLGPFTPGNSIFGVFRSGIIREVGPFCKVLAPDRLWIFQVALFGPIVSFQDSADSSWVRYVGVRMPSENINYQNKTLFGTSLFSRIINSIIAWQKIHAALLSSYTKSVKGIQSAIIEEALKETSWQIERLRLKTNATQTSKR